MKTYYHVYKQWSKRYYPWVNDKPELIAGFDTLEEAQQFIASENTAFEYTVKEVNIKC